MTTRRLVLIRHAKSKPEGEPDSARELAKRGRADAATIGRWLVEHDSVPDLAVVSPARRARQTWELAAAELDAAPAVQIDERIYDNTVSALRSVVRDVPDDIQTVAVIGHNPSMHGLAIALDGGGSATASGTAARAELDRDYPTSAVAVFAVPVSWARLDIGGAALTAFGIPRG